MTRQHTVVSATWLAHVCCCTVAGPHSTAICHAITNTSSSSSYYYHHHHCILFITVVNVVIYSYDAFLVTYRWIKADTSNTTVSQSSLISSTHHFYNWHPGSRCSSTCNQVTSKVDGGITEVSSGGQFPHSVQPHNPATGFWLPSATVVSTEPFRMEQGHCSACRRKWRLADTDMCPCGQTQTMSHIVKSCPLTKLNGGLFQLHSADEDAVSWLTNYGSWHAYEKKIKAKGLIGH